MDPLQRTMFGATCLLYLSLRPARHPIRFRSWALRGAMAGRAAHRSQCPAGCGRAPYYARKPHGRLEGHAQRPEEGVGGPEKLLRLELEARLDGRSRLACCARGFIGLELVMKDLAGKTPKARHVGLEEVRLRTSGERPVRFDDDEAIDGIPKLAEANRQQIHRVKQEADVEDQERWRSRPTVKYSAEEAERWCH
jgi:hypothetical protein